MPTYVVAILIALTGLLLPPTASHAASTPEALKVAISPWYFPIIFESGEGKPVGVDVDVAESIGKKLGLKVQFVVMAQDKIGAAVAAGDVDLGVSAIEQRSYLRGYASTIVDQTKIKLVPYYHVPMAFVVKDANTKTPEQLAGKVIGTLSYLESRPGLSVWKKEGAIGRVLGMENVDLLVNTFKMNRVDSVFLPLHTALELSASSKKLWHTVRVKDQKRVLREPLAMVLPAGGSERQLKIAKIAEGFANSKELREIAERWVELP